MLPDSWFDRDPLEVAPALLGKIIRFKFKRRWLAATIIETEAYKLEDKGSHASLGRTPKRQALFMPAGTIYMYFARGGDSLNVSCHGPGNAVLIKSGLAAQDSFCAKDALALMLANNPAKNTRRQRELAKLCSGQTLLCKSLGIKVADWNGKNFDSRRFFIDDAPDITDIILTPRLGIPKGRDEHLPWRFVHAAHAACCTKNPLTSAGAKKEGYRT